MRLQAFDAFAQLDEAGDSRDLERLGLGRKMSVECARRDTGFLGQPVHADTAESEASKSASRRLQNSRSRFFLVVGSVSHAASRYITIAILLLDVITIVILK